MQLAKSQAALAAAKARFVQQQKENEEIAERTKRQRLGLPEPRPVYQEVTCIPLWHSICAKADPLLSTCTMLPK